VFLYLSRSLPFTSLFLLFFRRCFFLPHPNCYLQALNDQMVNQVASALVEESFTEGQYIITQGEEGDKFYIIAEGSVKCTSTKEGGAEIDLITLKVRAH